MGILDEAIREHLDLKREHGADEAEVKDLESEAFGPAERPDAVSGDDSTTDPAAGDISDAASEAGDGEETRIIPREAFEAETAVKAAEEAAEPEAVEAEPEPEPDGEATVEHPIADVPGPPGPEPELDSSAGGGKGDDAGDLLEAERSHLSSYPTEHYDVDAAIAEEDEIDLLSESSLSDELDRALDGPTESSGPGSAEEAREDPAEPEDEPEAEFEPEFEAAPEVEEEEDVEAAESDPQKDPFEGEDGEDVLEETPDFLEETPEHDKLWFEQKEPKDFDFGD